MLTTMKKDKTGDGVASVGYFSFKQDGQKDSSLP